MRLAAQSVTVLTTAYGYVCIPVAAIIAFAVTGATFADKRAAPMFFQIGAA
jgi:hypothetical protein